MDKQIMLDKLRGYFLDEFDLKTDEDILKEINSWGDNLDYSDLLEYWREILSSVGVLFGLGELYISNDTTETFYYFIDSHGNRIQIGDFENEFDSVIDIVEHFAKVEYAMKQKINEGKQFELSTRKHLTDLVKNYVDNRGEEFHITFINNKGNIVLINETGDDDDNLDYSIYDSIFDIERFITIDGGLIIFNFDKDVSCVDKEDQEMYLSDYQDFIKDTDAYIKSKVDYIMELTWDK